MKKGTYSINATKNFVEYKATFGVGGNRTVKLTKGESSKVYGSLSLDNTVSVPAGNYMKFIPAETGNYTIRWIRQIRNTLRSMYIQWMT